jgi:P4 family phage/plasmid primase-like protien
MRMTVVDYDYNDVELALDLLSSDCTRDEWVKIGNSLKEALNAIGHDGYELFDKWSSKSPKYNKQDCKTAWKSFKPNGGITKATFFQLAYQAGWPGPAKKDFSTKKEFQPTTNFQTTQNSPVDDAKKHTNVLKQWHSLKLFSAHEYLDSKGLSDNLNGYESSLRIGYNKDLGNFFAYPLLDLETQEIVGFNRISMIDKRLGKDSKKTGNASIIGTLDNSTAIVCITEGFADGMHIHNATKHTTLVANDVGNIANVVKRMRKLYPECKIVVCADNDEAGRAGAEKAIKGLSNVVIAYPTNKDFSDDVLAGINIAELIQNAIDSVITTKKESDTSKSDKPSENLIALSIANRYKKRIAYDIDACEWRSYKNGIWEIVKPAKVQQAIQETLNKEFGKDYKLTFVKGIFGLLTSYVSHSKWDQDRDSVPFSNGVLNLKTKQFLPHTPKNYFTWQLPYEYNPTATCEPILNWLQDVCGDQSTVQLIRAFFNCTLVGRAYLQRYLELVGPGGTGKGTVLRLLVSMLGNRNCYSTELKNLEGNRFETAAIYGKRLTMITDAGGYGGEANTLKALTGQDWLRKEAKQKQQGDNYIYQGMVIILANQTIVFRDLSSAIPRRRITIEFNKVIAPYERRDLDKEFEPYIPGLLNWALTMDTNEVELLMRDTDRQVKSSLDAKKQVLIEGNTLIAWLHACVEYAPGNKVKVGMLSTGKDHDGHDVDKYENASKWLYPSYARYCVQTGNKSVSSKGFSRSLLDILNNTLGLKGISYGRDTQGYCFERLKLSSESESFESIVDFAFLPKKKVEI